MVRTAIAKPAGPTVSWPTTPWAMDVASSVARWRDAADADAGDDEVGAVDARLGRRRAPCTGTPCAMRDGEVGDDGQPRLVDVVEVDPIDLQGGAREAADEQRHAHAGAADDGELHDASSGAVAGRVLAAVVVVREASCTAVVFRRRGLRLGRSDPFGRRPGATRQPRACAAAKHLAGAALPAAIGGGAGASSPPAARGGGGAHGVAGGQAQRPAGRRAATPRGSRR